MIFSDHAVTDSKRNFCMSNVHRHRRLCMFRPFESWARCIEWNPWWETFQDHCFCDLSLHISSWLMNAWWKSTSLWRLLLRDVKKGFKRARFPSITLVWKWVSSWLLLSAGSKSVWRWTAACGLDPVSWQASWCVPDRRTLCLPGLWTASACCQGHQEVSHWTL